MRRLFIIRKDLHFTPGKLAAMVGLCCEMFWTNLLKSGTVEDLEYVTLPVEIPGNPDYWMLYRNLSVYMAAKAAHERGEKTFVYRAEHPESKYLISTKIDKSVWDEYVNGIFTKTICESRNLNHLLKAKAIADELGLKENEDYGFINDRCLTELNPENEDGTTTVGMWFAPLADEVAHKISRKFPLYRDHLSVEYPDKVTGHFDFTKEENSQRTEAESIRRFQEICKQSDAPASIDPEFLKPAPKLVREEGEYAEVKFEMPSSPKEEKSTYKVEFVCLNSCKEGEMKSHTCTACSEEEAIEKTKRHCKVIQCDYRMAIGIWKDGLWYSAGDLAVQKPQNAKEPSPFNTYLVKYEETISRTEFDFLSVADSEIGAINQLLKDKIANAPFGLSFRIVSVELYDYAKNN